MLFESMSLKGPRGSLYGTRLVPVTGFIIKSHGTSVVGSCGVFPVQHRARVTIQLYIQNVYMMENELIQSIHLTQTQLITAHNLHC